MGVMNLLKAKWDGKVGQTVGAKWKDKATIRTYSKPSNPRTEAQVVVRGAFSEMTKYVALFSDQIKYLSALDTSGMSVRNAIIKLNKAMIGTSGFDKATLQISRGGLQRVAGEQGVQASGTVTVTWDAPTATNFTSEAQLVAVMVQEATGMVDVVTALATAGTVSSNVTFGTAGNVDVFVYFLDKRGSSKVASASDYISVAIA